MLTAHRPSHSVLLALVLGLALSPSAATAASKTRLIVLTDISSLTAGVAEPDDGQSLIRLMLYANEFDIEGLIATSNLGHGQKTRPDLIRQVVDAYEKVRPNLLLHDHRYPPAEALRDAHQGGPEACRAEGAGRDIVGEGKDTEASDWIIRGRGSDRSPPGLGRHLGRLGRPGPGPLEGPARPDARGTGPLRLQASGPRHRRSGLDRALDPQSSSPASSRSPSGGPTGGCTGAAMRAWLARSGSRRTSTGTARWATSTPDYRGGDIWSGTLGPVRGIKEGDTPSFLSLVPNGLSDPDHPWLGSWGGRFAGEGPQQVDRRGRHDLETSRRPGPPDVLGLPLAAGVPGRLRRPARLVREAFQRGQSSAACQDQGAFKPHDPSWRVRDAGRFPEC